MFLLMYSNEEPVNCHLCLVTVLTLARRISNLLTDNLSDLDWFTSFMGCFGRSKSVLACLVSGLSHWWICKRLWIKSSQSLWILWLEKFQAVFGTDVLLIKGVSFGKPGNWDWGPSEEDYVVKKACTFHFRSKCKNFSFSYYSRGSLKYTFKLLSVYLK